MPPWRILDEAWFGDALVGLYHTTEELAGSEGRNTFDSFFNDKYTIEVYFEGEKVYGWAFEREHSALQRFRLMKDRLRARKDGLKPDASHDPAW
jgi:hypothetical protein